MWRRPPLPILFLAVLIAALAQTTGAMMGRYREEISARLTEAVSRRPAVHGLTGNRDYDAELIPQIVYQSEAQLSFFHTHGMGMGAIVVAGGTIVSSLVASRAFRGALHLLLAAGAVFPLGFLASSWLTVLLGKDSGAEWAERWILIPTGAGAIAAFVLLAGALLFQAIRGGGSEARG